MSNIFLVFDNEYEPELQGTFSTYDRAAEFVRNNSTVARTKDVYDMWIAEEELDGLHVARHEVKTGFAYQQPQQTFMVSACSNSVIWPSEAEATGNRL
jgi:hypothetical protein